MPEVWLVQVGGVLGPWQDLRHSGGGDQLEVLGLGQAQTVVQLSVDDHGGHREGGEEGSAL